MMPPRVVGESVKSPNLIFIDWLRGIAALLVFFFHLDLHIIHDFPKQQIPADSLTHYFVFGVIDLGKVAVGIFFLVSGFLIPSTLVAPGASLRTFVVHRVFRLYPAYWVAIAIAVLILTVMQRFQGDDVPNALLNLSMLQRFVGGRDVIGVFWTLQIELIFYFLCGVLFVCGRLRAHRFLILAAVMGALACAGARYLLGRNLPVAIFLALSFMFYGDLIRAYSQGLVSKRSLIGFGIMLVVALVPVTALAYGPEAKRYLLSYSVALLAFGVAFAAPAWDGRPKWIDGCGRFLANVSYSVYLLHDPIGMNLAGRLKAAQWDVVVVILLPLVATLGSAYLVYRFVEAPCIRLGKKSARALEFLGTRPVEKHA